MAKKQSWEAELEIAASQTIGQAAASTPRVGGARLSIRAGILTLNGKELKTDDLECVLVDFILENAYYHCAYDPENPVSPSCYALGRDAAGLAPSNKSSDKQATECAGCPQNQFGSADVGRGKACKNSYRVVLWVPDEAGRDEPELISLTAKLTVFKDFGMYVDSCANNLHRPYWAVSTKLSTVPDRKSQYRLKFELSDRLDKDSVAIVKQLRAERSEELLFADFPDTEDMLKNRKGATSKGGGGKRNKF